MKLNSPHYRWRSISRALLSDWTSAEHQTVSWFQRGKQKSNTERAARDLRWKHMNDWLNKEVQSCSWTSHVWLIKHTHLSLSEMIDRRSVRWLTVRDQWVLYEYEFILHEWSVIGHQLFKWLDYDGDLLVSSLLNSSGCFVSNIYKCLRGLTN